MKLSFCACLASVLALGGCAFDTTPVGVSSGSSGVGGSSGSSGATNQSGSTSGRVGSSGTASGSGGSVSGGSGARSGSTSGSGSGSTSGAGMDGGTGNDAGDSGPPGDPMLLSETGLYADIARGTLGTGVHPYQPQYVLWADGATKNRWVLLPAGSQIDTSDMNFWVYPNGSKLFKEFAVGGVRIETRMIMKRGPGDWFLMAYKWNAGQTEAVAVPNGETNSGGTNHDIPSQQVCGTCHNPMPDEVLGFNAVQLSHNIAGSLNLDQVVKNGWLTNNPTVPGNSYVIPGTAVEQKALGYLHANCGFCHNYRTKVFQTSVDMDVWLQVGKLGTVAQTTTYTTLVGHATTGSISNVPRRVEPRNPAMSAIHELMALRAAAGDAGASDGMRQMPPVVTATKVADPAGLGQIDAWINCIGAAAGGCTPPDAGP